MKKFIVFMLTLLTAISSLLPVYACDLHSQSYGGDETDIIEYFDWNNYSDTLSTTVYNLRLSVTLKNSADEVVLYQLISDNIIPAAVLSTCTLNDDVFLNFIEENVNITYFNETMRGASCCDNPRRAWITVAVVPTFNSNNWCIQHKKSEAQKCTNCGTIWQQRSTILSGCGQYRYSGYGYAVCPYAEYLNYI